MLGLALLFVLTLSVLTLYASDFGRGVFEKIPHAAGGGGLVTVILELKPPRTEPNPQMCRLILETETTIAVKCNSGNDAQIMVINRDELGRIVVHPDS